MSSHGITELLPEPVPVITPDILPFRSLHDGLHHLDSGHHVFLPGFLQSRCLIQLRVGIVYFLFSLCKSPLGLLLGCAGIRICRSCFLDLRLEILALLFLGSKLKESGVDCFGTLFQRGIRILIIDLDTAFL